MRSVLCAAALAAMMLATAGCEDWNWGPSDRYKEDFHYTRELAPGGTVSLENFNGPVEITSWDQSTVEINGTKYARDQALLNDMKIDVSGGENSVRIRTVRPSMAQGNCGARYSIHVPRRVALDEITSSNGEIRVEGIDGPARLRTSNGAVRLDGVKGEVNARTSNGAIEARNIDGNARLTTSNGAISADSSHGSFEATTSNSKIEATLRDPVSTWPVRLDTSNGHIDLTLQGTKIPDVRAGTSNSSITLHLPATVNARVHATTSHHNAITSDFEELAGGRDEERRRRRSEVEGTLGGGGPLIDLSTSNGTIHIAKL